MQVYSWAVENEDLQEKVALEVEEERASYEKAKWLADSISALYDRDGCKDLYQDACKQFYHMCKKGWLKSIPHFSAFYEAYEVDGAVAYIWIENESADPNKSNVFFTIKSDPAKWYPTEWYHKVKRIDKTLCR